MTPQEAAALLTYANQIDARIQLNDANGDVWVHALRNTDYTKAKWCIREHYASHVDGGPPRSLAPGMIRARVGELTRAAEGKRRAIEIARGQGPYIPPMLEGDPDAIAEWRSEQAREYDLNIEEQKAKAELKSQLSGALKDVNEGKQITQGSRP